MCRRYTLSATESVLRGIPWIDAIRGAHEPKYNIGPGNSAPVVITNRRGNLILETMRWGLVPSWAEDLRIGYKLATVPLDDANTSPAFQTSFRARRCLLLADGFYMWQTARNGTNTLVWFYRPGRTLFAIAGVWEEWASREARETLFTFAMITVSPKGQESATAEEWPAVLGETGRRRWMDLRATTEELVTLPGRPEGFLSRPVSAEVIWRVREGPECIGDPGT